MGFMDAIKTCLGKYAVFSGRAGRPEYWWFVLFLVLGVVLASLIGSAIFGSGPESSRPLGMLFHLATLLPMLAAGWRRMHETGRPGWYLLLPMALSVIFVFGLLAGVLAFVGAERAGVSPDQLRPAAAILGGTGMVVAMIAQLVLTVLMLVWLTRPSQPAANEYEPPPAR